MHTRLFFFFFFGRGILLQSVIFCVVFDTLYRVRHSLYFYTVWIRHAMRTVFLIIMLGKISLGIIYRRCCKSRRNTYCSWIINIVMFDYHHDTQNCKDWNERNPFRRITIWYYWCACSILLYFGDTIDTLLDDMSESHPSKSCFFDRTLWFFM